MFAFLEEWNRLTERIGFWLDLEHAYRTLDESYIESVWWALAQIDARGLLYEGHKVVPYCPRCETTLSSHEVALGYRDVVDRSVFLKLPRARRRGEAAGLDDDAVDAAGERGAGGLAGSDLRDASRCGGERFVLAEDRVAAVLGEQAEILERYSGSELVERFPAYEGPIFNVGEPGPAIRSSPTTS